jgi:predicted ArsR family transcriptional regulator
VSQADVRVEEEARSNDMSDLPEVSPELGHEIDAVAALKDHVRRALFLYVARAPDDVSRDQAAEAAGISRALAAFHLDKLVEEGLLEAAFRRLNGRSGPGAGRPSKLYRRSDREISLSLPAREYELAARILARALEADPGTDPRVALHDVAHEAGAVIGEKAGAARGKRREPRVTEVIGELAAHGFEPYQEGRKVYLANCPFHGLSRDHTQLVCGMNLSLMQGLVQGAAASGLKARLDPAEGRCCVVLEREKR